jgi:hypothetical protein
MGSWVIKIEEKKKKKNLCNNVVCLGFFLGILSKKAVRIW